MLRIREFNSRLVMNYPSRFGSSLPFLVVGEVSSNSNPTDKFIIKKINGGSGNVPPTFITVN